MATLKYWLWLTTRKGISNTGAMELVNHFGTPEAAFFADPQEYDLVPSLTSLGKKSLLDKNMDDVQRVLGECDRLGHRIITFADAGYPERLRNIYDPPVVLYLRGKEIHFDEEVIVSVIGSREPSTYGNVLAQRLGLDLAAAGAVVASGLARGLDTCGITGALRGGGKVIAVLGGGLDVLYPRENRYLFEDVAAAGTLVSEYPPGSEPIPSHFPARNRIISGLSLGVVVVEGGVGSGTRITARAALEQNRDVFAVPGPVDAPLSYTPNDLIRAGEAKLITSAQDILVEYQDLFPHKLHMPSEFYDQAPAILPGAQPPRAHTRGRRKKEPEEFQGSDREGAGQLRDEDGGAAQEEAGVDKSEKVTYIHWKDLKPTPTDDQRDILLQLNEGDRTLEELIELTQIPARRCGSAVTMLQLAGFVNEGPGKRFSSTVRIRTE